MPQPTGAAASGGGSGSSKAPLLAEIPAWRPKPKARLGHGNPKRLSVPGLPLRAHGIGVSPRKRVPVRPVGGAGNAFGWKPYGGM